MTNHFVNVTLCSVLLISANAFAQSSNWSLDPNHKHVDFQIGRVPVSNVRSSFSDITGTLIWDEKNPSQSHVEAIIPITNISTNNAMRDADLKSANFFDVHKYSTMTFRSTAVIGTPGEHF